MSKVRKGTDFTECPFHFLSPVQFQLRVLLFKYYKHTNNYVDFSAEEFEELVNKLLPTGQMFKFTGGEPTLNPELERDLSIVKQAGGTCFVDTNGSFPMLIEKLIQTNLVDLFGISLKGLSAAEAVKRSGTRNEESCWGNVLKAFQSFRIIPQLI